jgi:hypothetical protein
MWNTHKPITSYEVFELPQQRHEKRAGLHAQVLLIKDALEIQFSPDTTRQETVYCEGGSTRSRFVPLSRILKTGSILQSALVTEYVFLAYTHRRPGLITGAGFRRIQYSVHR